MFSTNHLILLTFSIAMIISASVLSVKYRLSSRKASVIFLVISIVSEIIKDMVNMIPSEFGGYVLDSEDIPLHLCSIVIFAIIFIVFTENDKLRSNIVSAVTVIGITAPPFALLIATEGAEFDAIITYQYFIYHSALMWYAIHHICTKQVDLGVSAYKRNLGYTLFWIFVTLYINSALSAYGVNFIFLREPPVEGLPILNLNHGWHFYYLVLICIAFISVSLVHVPHIIREKIAERKAETEQSIDMVDMIEEKQEETDINQKEG